MNSNDKQNTSGSSYERDQEATTLHQQTFNYLCEMRLIIGNKLASLYYFLKQNLMCWLLYTDLQKKTQYKRAVPFVKSQKR